MNSKWTPWPLVLAAFFSSGCVSENFSITKSFQRLLGTEFPRESPSRPIVKVVSTWEVAEGIGPDGKFTRGFAGKIYFFTRNSPLPAIVSGQMRIYEFDDHGTPEEQSRPLHQFDFDSETLRGLMAVGTLGPTYTVFVPYVRKTSDEATCGLRIRYTDSWGGIVFSDPIEIRMPGRSRGPIRKDYETLGEGDEETVMRPRAASQESVEDLLEETVRDYRQQKAGPPPTLERNELRYWQSTWNPGKEGSPPAGRGRRAGGRGSVTTLEGDALDEQLLRGLQRDASQAPRATNGARRRDSADGESEASPDEAGFEFDPGSYDDADADLPTDLAAKPAPHRHPLDRAPHPLARTTAPAADAPAPAGIRQASAEFSADGEQAPERHPLRDTRRSGTTGDHPLRRAVESQRKKTGGFQSYSIEIPPGAMGR